jgi:tRNA nucleotidyltransferase (CCA-adding enzyme)
MKLIILPIGADLDALSSAYGVLKIYPDALLLEPKQLSKSAARVFKDFYNLFEERLLKEAPQKVETLILVDNSYLDRLPVVPKYENLIIWDHHEVKNLPYHSGRIEKVGACTTLLVEEIKNRNVEITPREATLLILGIYEDTGNFLHLGTTERDFYAAGYLLSEGADLTTVREYIEEKISKDELEVVYKLLKGIEYIETPEGFRVAVATFKGEEYRPDFQDLVYELKEFTENVDGFFIIYEAGNKTYLFGRSNNPKFNTADILRRLGGGGHKEASSLKLEGVSAERIKKRLIDILQGNIPNIYLENFISYPALTLPVNLTAKEALKILTDYNFAGAPVVDEEGKPLGVVFKKDLLRALKHLKNPKVEDVYNPDIRSLNLKDTIWDAEEILTKYGQKLIPVTDERDKVVGVLTRLDILTNILKEIPESARRKKIRLPDNIRDFAETVGKLAKKLGMKAYIVGGVVRDIILGKPVWDIDIVVEGGNAIELAKEVAKHYGVKYHPFEEFKTAHLKIGNLKVEFATARRESYERSGAYPKIEPASLKEDIFRRDFTINTMAISINPEDFEILIDYLGGLEDLKKGIIRVLHPASFIEDPVRILRALRFAGRFGFELSKGTKTLLKQAVKLGVLKNAPRGRIANELRLAMREENFLRILELYRKYKVLEQILPDGFQWSMVKERSLQKLHELLKEFPEIKKPGWVLFVNLLLGLKEEAALRVLKELSAPSDVIEIYKQAKRDFRRIINSVKSAGKPSELLKLLKPYRPEALLIVASRTEDKQVEELIKFYLKKLKPYKVKVDIEKFKKMGLKGKELGEAVEREKAKLLDEIFKDEFLKAAKDS